MNALLQWLGRWSIGDVISTVGVGIAIWQIRRAKLVTEQLRDAVQRNTVVLNLNELIISLQEIKELQRVSARSLLRRRYTDARMKLIRVRDTFPTVTSAHRGAIQKGITILRQLEKAADERRKEEADPATLNTKVNRQIDRIVEILVMMENEEGFR